MSSDAAPDRAAPGTDPGSDALPQRLRDARERSGLSLRTLAKRLDISASALSQIETGKSRPSVRTLYALVSELGISLDDLFDHRGDTAGTHPPDQEAVARGIGDWIAAAGVMQPLVHGTDRATLELDTGVIWERLTSEHDPLIDFLQVTYEPGSTSNAHGKLVRHAGREYGIVLHGRIDVTIGFETYGVGAGDSICFSSDEPHVLANNGAVPAVAIWFVVGRRQSDPRQPLFQQSGSGVDAGPG